MEVTPHCTQKLKICFQIADPCGANNNCRVTQPFLGGGEGDLRFVPVDDQLAALVEKVFQDCLALQLHLPTLQHLIQFKIYF